jgi:hypothetical protein
MRFTQEWIPLAIGTLKDKFLGSLQRGHDIDPIFNPYTMSELRNSSISLMMGWTLPLISTN